MAVLLIIAGFGVHNRRENERRRLAEIAEGERAKEQVMLAMRIASAKLNVAQEKGSRDRRSRRRIEITIVLSNK